eukprot:6491953-Amphidinium_carterae.1
MGSSRSPSSRGKGKHANCAKQDGSTFAGEFEELLLPFFDGAWGSPRSPFREFVLAGQQLLQGYLLTCAEGAEIMWPKAPLDLLPCGLPYKNSPLWVGRPLLLKGLSSRRRSRRRRTLRRQAWINLMVAALSWLSMGRPARGMKADVLCLDHNEAQREALRWLHGWVRLQCPTGRMWEISLPQGRGLHGILDLLGDGDTYGRMGVSTPDRNLEFTPPSTEAKWIDAKTVSLPTCSAMVDLQTVLPPELFALLSVPGMLERVSDESEKEALSLPALFMRVRDWDELSLHLVQTGLCCLGEDRWSPTWGARHLRAGVFGVEKPDTCKVRMIVDRRRKNATEVSMRTSLYGRCGATMSEDRLHLLKRHMTLPHSLQFGDLLLPRHCELDMSVMDCKDFFYLLRVPEAAIWCTAVGRPVSSAVFRGPPLPEGAVRCDLDVNDTVTLFLQAPAMGDLKSVEIAQAAHTTVLLRAGMQSHEWLTLNSPAPTQGAWRGCYVDDYFQGVVVPAVGHHLAARHRADMLEIGQVKLDRTRQEYERVGFIEKESKTHLHETHAVVWGGEVHSGQRWVAGSRKKMERLLLVTVRVLRSKRKWISVKVLERIIGHWVHQLLFQRVGMALLDDLYSVLNQRRAGKGVVMLTRGALDELTMLVCLWPLFTADLGRPISKYVTATDATLTRGGAVIGEVSPSEATWLWHRLPRRAGSISWVQETNELGVLESGQPDEELE